ncbi:hypothetical protein PCE1_003658 [Barthelona sp. PCE]
MELASPAVTSAHKLQNSFQNFADELSTLKAYLMNEITENEDDLSSDEFFSGSESDVSYFESEVNLPTETPVMEIREDKIYSELSEFESTDIDLSDSDLLLESGSESGFSTQLSDIYELEAAIQSPAEEPPLRQTRREVLQAARQNRNRVDVRELKEFINQQKTLSPMTKQQKALFSPAPRPKEVKDPQEYTAPKRKKVSKKNSFLERQRRFVERKNKNLNELKHQIEKEKPKNRGPKINRKSKNMKRSIDDLANWQKTKEKELDQQKSMVEKQERRRHQPVITHKAKTSARTKGTVVDRLYKNTQKKEQKQRIPKKKKPVKRVDPNAIDRLYKQHEKTLQKREKMRVLKEQSEIKVAAKPKMAPKSRAMSKNHHLHHVPKDKPRFLRNSEKEMVKKKPKRHIQKTADRMYNQHEEKAKRIAKLKTFYELSDMKDCSFQPKLVASQPTTISSRNDTYSNQTLDTGKDSFIARFSQLNNLKKSLEYPPEDSETEFETESEFVFEQPVVSFKSNFESLKQQLHQEPVEDSEDMEARQYFHNVVQKLRSMREK